jgi:hypothetical protein
MLALAPIKLLPLGGSQWDFLWTRCNAVPDFSDESQAVFDAESEDFVDLYSHDVPYSRPTGGFQQDAGFRLRWLTVCTDGTPFGHRPTARIPRSFSWLRPSNDRLDVRPQALRADSSVSLYRGAGVGADRSLETLILLVP